MVEKTIENIIKYGANSYTWGMSLPLVLPTRIKGLKSRDRRTIGSPSYRKRVDRSRSRRGGHLVGAWLAPISYAMLIDHLSYQAEIANYTPIATTVGIVMLTNILSGIYEVVRGRGIAEGIENRKE